LPGNLQGLSDQVFDGQGEGVATALGAGAVASPDPEGDVHAVELVPLATAIDRPAGCFWSYPFPGAGQEPSVFEPH
jgi:hypothetical protein